MKLADLLPQYSDEALDQLASDKLDDVTHVRLPRPVLEREIASALGSYSYVAGVLAGSQPPSFAFLKLLMESPDRSAPAAGFSEAVMGRTDEITTEISTDPVQASSRNVEIYLAVLGAAWESDGRVNATEAHLLQALRSKLGITMREHLRLEHHPSIRHSWDSARSYATARNYLLARGIVLTSEDRFVLPDEVRLQVRSYWEMELHDADYRQLLDSFNIQELRTILEDAGLQLSGSKDERIERIVTGMVPPSSALEAHSILRLRELSRDLQLPVTLPKSELIGQLIHHFDGPIEIVARQMALPGETEEALPATQTEHARELLQRLSGNQLYEILLSLGLRRSGSKSERIIRMLDSGHPLGVILSQLRRRDLVALCRKLGLAVSGLKEELIDRLTGATLLDGEASQDEEDVLHLPLPEETDPSAPPPAADRGSAPPDRVKGIADIEHDFPGLERDEQTILALQREARSLNERDLQRLAARHGLGWMLPKAHMSELLRKLVTWGQRPIRIRSTGAANIYEWVDGSLATSDGMDRLAARDVIEALRQGVVPERGLDVLFVGQDETRAHLREQLKYIAAGRSSFKFIRGAYGAGKSFLLAWLRNHALDSGFAVSTVRVSAEMTMADLANLYRGLMDGLRTPEKRGASSLADVLESWLLAMQRKVENVEGLSPHVPAERERLAIKVRQRIKDEMAHVATHDPGLASALDAFYEARVHGKDEVALTALAYIRGDTSVSNAALRQINVRGQLESEQVLPRLRAMLEIIAATHLKGLAILIDELELVRRRPHRQTRDQAYETLRALIDEAGENRLRGSLIVCTGTDELFADEKAGLPSYAALSHRIDAPPLGDQHRSLRQPIISLDGLDAERLRKVALKTREVHAKAYEWPAEERVTDLDIEYLVGEWTRFGGERIDRLPRPFLRQLVHVLDLCEENPDLSARDTFSEPELDQDATEALLDLVSF